MAFHESLFPTSISYGARGGPGFRSDIVELDSGAEQIVSHWNGGRHQYNVAHGVKSFTNLAELKRFHMARRGASAGFRFLDPLDFTSASDGVSNPDDEDQVIGTGDGTTVAFQIVKLYTDGVIVRTRNIKKPVHGTWGNTVVVALDGVNQASGWSVDSTSGLLTFDVAPGVGVVITVGFKYHVPVRFGADVDRLMEADFESLKSGTVSSISLIEMLDEDFTVDEYFHGGASSHDFTAPIYLRESNGFVQALNPSGSGRSAHLPDETNLPTGGVYFWLENISAFNMTIKDFAGDTSWPLDAGGQVLVSLGLIDDVKTWFVAEA